MFGQNNQFRLLTNHLVCFSQSQHLRHQGNLPAIKLWISDDQGLAVANKNQQVVRWRLKFYHDIQCLNVIMLKSRKVEIFCYFLTHQMMAFYPSLGVCI